MAWPRRKSSAERQIQRRRGFCLAAAFLVTSIVGPASASATLPDEATEVTGSVVETVTQSPGPAVPATVPDAPPTVPQQVPVDPAPPPPVAAPGGSQVAPALPHAVSETASPSGGSPSPADRVAHAVRQPADAAARAPTESAGSPSPQGIPATDPGAESPQSTRHADEERGIEAPQFAPDAWFLAHVWPAIKLEPDLKHARTSTLNRPAAGPDSSSEATSGLLTYRGVGRLAANFPLSESSAAPKSPSSPPWEPVLSTAVRILFYAAIAALLALLALMIRAEISPAARWPGHRG
jgi:hypothetical protein